MQMRFPLFTIASSQWHAQIFPPSDYGNYLSLRTLRKRFEEIPVELSSFATITDCPPVIEWIIETILIKATALMGHGHGKRKLVQLRLLPLPGLFRLRLFGRAIRVFSLSAAS